MLMKLRCHTPKLRLATGNPLIIEKCQLDLDVNKLKILQASHLSQKHSLEDKILKDYPQEIKRLTERIAGYSADIQTATRNSPPDSFPPMKIGGILHSEKADAGKAIIEACKAMTSPDSIPLGEYRGFSMELSFDTYSKDYGISIKGALTHDVKLGTDIHGNITRIDNKIEGFSDSLENCKGKFADVQIQLDSAKGEVDKPFPQESEYAEKSARLKEVNILLNMDEKSKEIFDEEPDEGDIAPTRRVPERER